MFRKLWPSTADLICVIVTVAWEAEAAQKKLPGHFCKICGVPKSNESFSGRGHATHICKACSHSSTAQQAVQITLRHLKIRTHGHRPEVKLLADMVYAERFPRLVRNQKTRELSVQTLTLSADSETCNFCGGLVYIKENCPKSVERRQSSSDDMPHAIGLPLKIPEKVQDTERVNTFEVLSS